MKNVTIVMYHYVRDLSKTRYPIIKGLKLKNFILQLDYLDHNYTIVRMEDCIEALNGKEKGFPDDAVLLTFDDGYLDHYTEVFPILSERKIQGSFFPPVQSSVEDKVLDVNKIHFILASSEKPEELVTLLTNKIKDYQWEFNLEEPQYYYNRVKSSEHMYDPIEIIKFKRVLQRELPVKAREIIISELFKRFVNISEDVFSHELYMNEDQLQLLKKMGMFIGGHGYSHKWLNSLDQNEQKNEIIMTGKFLDSLGVEKENRVMCYPYGAYDNFTLLHLRKEKYTAGLSTKPEKALLTESNRFTLPRLDTNEIPIF